MRVIYFRWRSLVSVLALLLIATGMGLYLGEKNRQEEILVMAPLLAGKMIILDPGHGGYDPGAKGKNGGVEKEITLAVSQRLALALAQSGAGVLMTRNGDYDLAPEDVDSLSLRKQLDLKKRVEIAESAKADLFLSIHVNAFPSEKWYGAQTFYQWGDARSKQLAEAIQSELQRITGTRRVAKTADIFTNRVSSMPSATVEIGFISNPQEEKLMMDPDYQNKVAWAIYCGILQYYTKINQTEVQR
ncbi:MAG: N-acetylmuramoyl-L-alanine amidase CwlD [Bacillota bacterium]